MITEQKMIEACIEGNQRAHHLLYRKYATGMMGICMRYAKNRTEAQDILQDGFIKVFSNLKSFRFEGSFEGWIKRIMINTAVNHYRENLKHDIYSTIDEFEETTGFQEHLKESQESNYTPSQEELLNMINELPNGYRIVFNLFAIEGFNHKEIAQMLNITENTSKTQLFKARRHLKNKIYSRMRKI
jgi:RNA polymerase sigma-70 factor (ECF subfamily)